MNTYVAAATKLAGTMAPPAVAGRPLAWFAVVAAVLLVPLAVDVLSLDALMRATSAAFVAVYVTSTAAGVRLLSGAARASSVVALAAVLVVFAFSGPYVLVPVLISCALRFAALRTTRRRRSRARATTSAASAACSS
jgi:amino acid efflux transporter